jgi:hypothetical protein
VTANLAAEQSNLKVIHHHLLPLMTPIQLIPPTHEQSVFTFHVEERLATRLLEHLKVKGLEPWRPPAPLEKEAPDGEQIIQIEVETAATEAMLQDLIDEFLNEE